MRILGFEEIPLYIHGGRPDTFGEDAADSESARIPERRIRFGGMDTAGDGLYRGQETGDISLFVETGPAGCG